MPSHWVIYLPPGFICKTAQGIDSEPGYIYSGKDSITLRFDSGKEMVKLEGCDLHQNYLRAKSQIVADTAPYNGHRVEIDTIGDNIAIITKSLTSDKKTIDIEFLPECHSGYWLGINGANLSPKKQELVLKIIKTISLESK